MMFKLMLESEFTTSTDGWVPVGVKITSLGGAAGVEGLGGGEGGSAAGGRGARSVEVCFTVCVCVNICVYILFLF